MMTREESGDISMSHTNPSPAADGAHDVIVLEVVFQAASSLRG